MAGAEEEGSEGGSAVEPGSELRATGTWSAGIVNHGSFADLARCLASIAMQSRPPASVRVYDTGEDPNALEDLRLSHPTIAFESGSNLGYAGGANRVIAGLLAGTGEAATPSSPSRSPEFVLLLNPDVELDPTFAERLVGALVESPRAAIGCGKLLRPGRERIDSAGIRFPRHRRPRDRGSEEPDRGQFDRRERVDAASGAAMLLRASAIAALRLGDELFDELFFAYHEDTDLCWRARRLGYEILYEPQAIAIHRRGWRRSERERIPVAIRRHSFKNHYLQLVKNETGTRLLANAPWLVAWELLRLGFVLVRDPGLLPAYLDALAEMPAAWRKRRLLAERIDALAEGAGRSP